jgi:hypothetical protein
LIPIVLGFDGNFSRIDGIILILSGLTFFFTISLQENMFRKKFINLLDFIINFFFLIQIKTFIVWN